MLLKLNALRILGNSIFASLTRYEEHLQVLHILEARNTFYLR